MIISHLDYTKAYPIIRGVTEENIQMIGTYYYMAAVAAATMMEVVVQIIKLTQAIAKK